MAKLKLLNTIFSKLGSLSKSNGQIIVTRDSKSLYVDLEGERIEITDWIDIDTEESLLAILTPLINKYYYTKDTNKIWRYIGGEWKCLNDSADDLAPTYTESSTLLKLSSGEKLSVAFGKISKAITDLISHIGDSVKHITSTERTNWNSAKTHADSAHARTDATKVEKSSTNGNIKINGTETTVYTHPSGTNPHGTTKSDVGLGNVDNTKDIDKPISTKQQKKFDELNSNLDELAYGEFSGNDNICDIETNYIFPINIVKVNQVGQVYTKNIPQTSYGYFYAYISANLTEYKNGTIAYYIDKNDAQKYLGQENIVNKSYRLPTSIKEFGLLNWGSHEGTISGIMFSETSITSYEPYIPSVKMLADEVNAQKNDLTDHESDTIKHITSTERTNWNSAKTHADSAHAPSNAQVNVIETIKVNGTALTPSSKAVNITVPTNNNQLTNGAGYITSSGTAKTISDTLPISKGGTGKTTAKAAEYNILSDMTESTDNPNDDSLITYTYMNPSETQGKLYWRKVSTLWNYIKSKLATVATSGSYNDLSNKPTIPSVGNGTVTIKQAGTSKGTFTMNQSGNTTIELTDNNTTYGVATSSALGLVKSGTDITVDSSGNVSVNDNSHTHTIANVSGLQDALNSKKPNDSTTFLLYSDYVAVRTPGRTANMYYEFWDSNVGWANIMAGNITTSGNFVGNLSGNASTATALTTSAGSTTQPVYFSGGKPVACTYTLGKSVPSNAVFTDTNTWRGIQNNLTSDSTTDSLSAAQGKVLKGLVDGKAASSHTHNYAGSSSAGGAATSAVSVVDYGDSSKTIKIGFAGIGATTSNLAYIAGYLSGGTQIKDVDKGTLKSWLGLGSAAYTSSGNYATASHTHTKSQITDFPTSLPASDVYSWAKASSKPSYSWSEITNKPSSFTPASHNHELIIDSNNKETPIYITYSKDELAYDGFTYLTAWYGYELRKIPKTLFATASHTHSYLPLSGGIVSGTITADNLQSKNGLILTNTYSTADASIKCYWKDNSLHEIVTRSSNGLSSYFGWAGSSSYSTTTWLRGRTCKYQNASGTATLSDVRMKKDFRDLDVYDKFFDAIEPCAFRMTNGSSGRYHIGYKAQQIEQALIDSGLTTQDFAGFIRMPYIIDKEDKNGTKAHEEAGIKEGDDELSIIYTEFAAMNTYQIQKCKKEISNLKNEISNLKNEIAELKNIISNLNA